MGRLCRIAALVLLAACFFAVQAQGKPRACRVPDCKECETSRKCKTCKQYRKGPNGKPKWPLYLTESGRCKKCSSCPYSKGWASCGPDGSCLACREGDGFRLSLDGTQCECAIEGGYRPTRGGCTQKPCRNPVKCLVEPCAIVKCISGTTCVDDYCGGCKAVCVPDKNPCPEPVQCLVDPCRTAFCPKGSACQADYCHGGCNYRCVDQKVCGEPVACLIDPCRDNDCQPWEDCVSSYCGQCSHTCIPKED